MWILFVVAAVAVAGFVRGLVTGDLGHTGAGWIEVVAQLGIAAVASGLFLYFRGARRRDHELLAALAGHRAALLAGDTVTVRGRPVQLATAVRHTEATVSLLVVSLKLPDRWHLEGEARAGTSAVCSLTSLLFGWWGIPWGPIWTVQTLAGVVRGGQRRTVGELVASLDAVA